ncbi:hypothetical protein HOL21_02520 [Candidatus Woesearchaeota archaeon]|jgi:hypothetical protein|nr:hypothetical protein [Candidatus Woesearchaeota archaeon]MBT5397065.1 hypothetical protein [Candidatus Woesearchaeota archaeon]MBT5924812.1 hypothetical protein [Candidatus Woesearchaeota archaeon]MBT6367389.1 hypothetical protein [Candidatus Woesearchaeota archaeon]MBT7762465.1 hypothetical protein [Candidatus Woesearchaeota archaeon]
MKTKIVIGLLIVCLFLIGCAVPEMVDDVSSEEQEIVNGFSDLDELDALEKELDDIDFETVDTIEIE